jgi:hypothetical protein
MKMMDDLKALRDEIESEAARAEEAGFLPHAAGMRAWAARLTAIIERYEKERAEASDLLEAAWGIIANAGAGNWERESRDWQNAAPAWRDEYLAWQHRALTERAKP